MSGRFEKIDSEINGINGKIRKIEIEIDDFKAQNGSLLNSTIDSHDKRLLKEVYLVLKKEKLSLQDQIVALQNLKVELVKEKNLTASKNPNFICMIYVIGNYWSFVRFTRLLLSVSVHISLVCLY